MSLAAVEPLSPELALVCPELRARAIAALPELPWLAVRGRGAERLEAAVQFAPAVPVLGDAVEYVLTLVGQLGVAAAGVVLITLVLTMLAAFVAH